MRGTSASSEHFLETEQYNKFAQGSKQQARLAWTLLGARQRRSSRRASLKELRTIGRTFRKPFFLINDGLSTFSKLAVAVTPFVVGTSCPA